MLLSSSAMAQENLKWDPQTASVSNSRIVQAPDKSAKEIYTLTQKWFLDQFKNAGKVIQYENPEAAVIEGKYSASYPYMMNSASFYHTIKIEAKDGRLKVTINPGQRIAGAGDFTSYVAKKNGDPIGSSKKMWAQGDDETTALINSLEKAINSPDKKADW